MSTELKSFEEIKQLTEYGTEYWLVNQLLVEAAKGAGIISDEEYAVFQNRGNQGLYGGLSVADITMLSTATIMLPSRIGLRGR